MLTLIIDPRYSISESKAEKQTHPNSPQSSKTSFKNISEQFLSLFRSKNDRNQF